MRRHPPPFQQTGNAEKERAAANRRHIFRSRGLPTDEIDRLSIADGADDAAHAAGNADEIKRRASANVCVGTRLSPQSLGTGAFDLAIMWVVECGSLARTCNGPIRSSSVRSGKMTKPRLRFDMPWLRAPATTGVSPRNTSCFSDIVQPQDVGHRIKAGLLAARPMCGVQRAARENHAILGAVRKLYALGRPGKNRRMLADDRTAAQ